MSAIGDSSSRGGILVVDDSPANLQLLMDVLKTRGYEVRPVPSGKLALQAARHDPPDLILLDVRMPEMNGYEVCERLKADERLKDIPVIFISAMSETMDKVKAFGVGGVDYVTKPFQFDEVAARVEAHLELRRQRRELQESHERLRRLETLRDDLVHMIVHDLRSPLTAICGFLDVLKSEGGLPAKVLEDVEQVLVSARKMARMVNSVLDVSKMESGKMQLNLSEFDVGDVVKQVLADLKPLVENRHMTFDSPETRTAAVADRELVSRIVQNLVDNALKFTPAGGYIRVGLATGANVVRVSVSDTGPGISAEFRKRIFEKFGQVGGNCEPPRYSTGIGLAFCKLAVEAHGGRIGVESEEGKGSNFWFELPARGSQPPSTPEKAVQTAHAG